MECKLAHPVKNNFGKVIGYKPHHYVAGECIENPCNQGGYASFLLATYPAYQSTDYKESKKFNGGNLELQS